MPHPPQNPPLNSADKIGGVFGRATEVLVAAIIFWWCGHGLKPAERARLLRQTLEHLGAVFVKFGQFLSMRPDFLPLGYCQELFGLLENVPPFPYTQARAIFLETFGQPPEKFFASFEKEPFASASFGQVHLAYLKTGEKVAVKVQRPEIEKSVQRDVGILKFSARALKWLTFCRYDFVSYAEEFAEWAKEELDYTTEAERGREFYESARGAENLRVPKIFSQFCGAKILTAEFIEGLTLNKILTGWRTRDRKIIASARRLGFTPVLGAELILKVFLRQIFAEGIFHADQHPANIIFTPEKKLALIDFGIVGRLDKKARLLSLRFSRFTLGGAPEKVFETFLEYNDTSAVKNLAALKKAFEIAVKKHQDNFSKKDSTSKSRHFFGPFLLEGVKLAQRYGVKIPLETLRFFRAMSLFESLLFYTDPDLKIATLARKFRNFSAAYALSELPELFTPRRVQKTAEAVLNVLEREILKSY